MAANIYLTRTVRGERSDLAVEFLVVPLGESHVLQAADISHTQLAQVFSEASTDLSTRGGSRQVASLLEDVASRLNQEAAADLQEVAQQRYIPVPGSPEIPGEALSSIDAATAIELFHADELVGFAVQQPEFILLATFCWYVGRPIGDTVRRGVTRAGQYVLTVWDRTLAQGFGFQLAPTADFPEATPAPQSAAAERVSIEDGLDSHDIGGSPERPLLILRVLISNGSQRSLSLLRPRVEFDASPTIGGTLEAMVDRSAPRGQQSVKILDLDAGRTVQIEFQFKLSSVVSGQAIRGTLLVESNQSDVEVEPYQFDLTAFSD